MPSRRSVVRLIVGTAILSTLVATPQASANVAAANAIDRQQAFVRLVKSIQTYQVVMTKQQRIRSRLRETETILLKQSQNPDCRYLKWTQPPFAGREVILCAARYYGQLQLHDPSMPGFTSMSVDPNGTIARNGNLRPISQSGIYALASTLQWDYEQAAKLDELSSWHSNERFVEGQSVVCRRSERFHGLGEQPYSPGAIEICFDAQALPIEVQFWNQTGELMERYTFKHWELNPTFPERVFDKQNKDYGF